MKSNRCWIYENMVDENYSSFTKTGPNKGNYKLEKPENHRKERKEGKGERAREKRLATVLSFYSVDFRDKKPVPKVTHRLLLRATWFL